MLRLRKLNKAIMGSPLLWGVVATTAFYVPIHTGRWPNAFVHRYFAGHPVEHVAVLLFAIGISAAVLKAFDLAGQFQLARGRLLPQSPRGGQAIADCETLLEQLARAPFRVQETYLVRRLRDALEHVWRSGTASTLEEHLRFLAENDVARMHASYALIRIIIWAIPILGLLGTVIGITAAVANLSAAALENSISQVTAGLAVAFDHTALALGLSIGLMFSQFLVERYENKLLLAVDAQIARELVGRFEHMATTTDPAAAGMHRVVEGVMAACERLVHRQAELWQSALDGAQRQWSTVMARATEQVQPALAAAVGQATKDHAQALIAAEQAAAQQNLHNWSQVHRALLENAEAVTLQQRELTRQGDVLLEVVQATGQVAKLEAELNRNLAALAGAKNFEQTVMSLSAAIHLLNGRLAHVPGDVPRVDLKSVTRPSKAA